MPPATWGGGGGGGNEQHLQQQQQRQRSQQQHYLSEAAVELLTSCRTAPDHVATSLDKVGIGGSHVLVDGLVAFCHTPAAAQQQQQQQQPPPQTLELKQERAKLLSRLVVATNQTVPPTKGSTLVVALSSNNNHLDHPSVSRHLMVLGTWYNLLVVVGIEQDQDETIQKEVIVSKLLKDVSPKVLPTHRILLATSVTGRVALVRQLSRVELVVDWDKEVSSQLERFGYKVALLPGGLGSVLD